MKFRIGDIVQMRKQHPCGSFEWEVMRVGADFRIKCLGCGRVVMLPRAKFERSVKAVKTPDAPVAHDHGIEGNGDGEGGEEG
ncbi:MAG: DUF951 domain-containing protein [Firmicutes bacterium]|nr:DUF951 domain-containing protein [Bacillota bacterium]